MLSIRVAEVDVIRVGLEILGKSMLNTLCLRNLLLCHHDHVLEGQHTTLNTTLFDMTYKFVKSSHLEKLQLYQMEIS